MFLGILISIKIILVKILGEEVVTMFYFINWKFSSPFPYYSFHYQQCSSSWFCIDFWSRASTKKKGNIDFWRCWFCIDYFKYFSYGLHQRAQSWFCIDSWSRASTNLTYPTSWLVREWGCGDSIRWHWEF